MATSSPWTSPSDPRWSSTPSSPSKTARPCGCRRRTHMPKQITEAELVDRLARPAQKLADQGAPLAAVGEALVTVGLRFEVASYGARAVAGRLALASRLMGSLADE